MFSEAKDDGSGGDNWSYKSCKAPVKSSPSTNQHPVILQAGCPSCRPSNSVKALKGTSETKKCFPSCFLRLPTRAVHLPRRCRLAIVVVSRSDDIGSASTASAMGGGPMLP